MTAHQLNQELVDRLAAFKVRVHGAVEGLRSGLHRSPHRGASVVFAEHKDYRPGDDTRLLDWRAYARNDRFTIKRFEQETHLSAHLVLDASSSMAYGAEKLQKAGYAATLLGALGLVLLKQGDTTSAFRIAGGQTQRLPGRCHPDQLNSLLTFLSEPPDVLARTALSTSLIKVGERVGKRGLVIIASDLLDSAVDALRALPLLRAQGHEVWVFQVLHPDELELPFSQATKFTDPEGSDSIETQPNEIRDAYSEALQEFLHNTQDQCMASGCKYMRVSTHQPLSEVLALALRQRGARAWA